MLDARAAVLPIMMVIFEEMEPKIGSVNRVSSVGSEMWKREDQIKSIGLEVILLGHRSHLDPLYNPLDFTLNHSPWPAYSRQASEQVRPAVLVVPIDAEFVTGSFAKASSSILRPSLAIGTFPSAVTDRSGVTDQI